MEEEVGIYVKKLLEEPDNFIEHNQWFSVHIIMLISCMLFGFFSSFTHTNLYRWLQSRAEGGRTHERGQSHYAQIVARCSARRLVRRFVACHEKDPRLGAGNILQTVCATDTARSRQLGHKSMGAHKKPESESTHFTFSCLSLI